jgi:hypothetical protein
MNNKRPQVDRGAFPAVHPRDSKKWMVCISQFVFPLSIDDSEQCKRFVLVKRSSMWLISIATAAVFPARPEKSAFPVLLLLCGWCTRIWCRSWEFLRFVLEHERPRPSTASSLCYNCPRSISCEDQWDLKYDEWGYGLRHSESWRICNRFGSVPVSLALVVTFESIQLCSKRHIDSEPKEWQFQKSSRYRSFSKSHGNSGFRYSQLQKNPRYRFHLNALL